MAETIEVGVTEAHNRLSELINLVREGTIVEISKRGSIVARLVPAQAEKPPPKGNGPFLAGLVEKQVTVRRGPERTAEEIELDLRVERASWESRR